MQAGLSSTNGLVAPQSLQGPSPELFWALELPQIRLHTGLPVKDNNGHYVPSFFIYWSVNLILVNEDTAGVTIVAALSCAMKA